MSDEQQATRPITPEDGQQPQGDPVKSRILITVIVIVALLAWYIAADRVTPFTNQARMKAFVVPVAAQVAGVVERVNVASNQNVQAGDLLFSIEQEQYLIALQRAEADLSNARQQIDASVVGLEKAYAQLASANANLERNRKDFERLSRVFKEDPGAISQRRLDLSEANYEEAKSRVTAAEAEIERVKTQIGDSGPDNPSIMAARSALEKAQLDLARTEVRAPAAGMIADVVVDAGNFAGAGQPQMTFIAIHDVWIEAAFTENNLGHVNIGDDVALVLDAQPGTVFEGKVRNVSWGVSTNSGAAPGALPTVSNSRDWLRPAQRFLVSIDVDIDADAGAMGRRVGAQADVLIYTGDNPIMNALGWLYIHLVALLSYLY